MKAGLLASMLLVLLSAAAAEAQITSDFPPLSPADAVAVLRGSHSVADYTDYRTPGDRPTIVVMGDSTTPWDWPPNAFAPTRPLSNDPDWYAPNYGGFYGANYLPHYGSSYRLRSNISPRPRVEHHVAGPAHRAPAPRSTVMAPARSGGRAAARGR